MCSKHIFKTTLLASEVTLNTQARPALQHKSLLILHKNNLITFALEFIKSESLVANSDRSEIAEF